MANEIGRWNAGGDASSRSLFANTAYASINAADTYTAITGDVITAVRAFRLGTGSVRTASIALYTVVGGVPSTLVQETPITINASGMSEVTGLSWSLTNGVTYCLAIGEISGGFSLTALAEAASTSHDDVGDNQFAATWGVTTTSAFRMELAGDVTNGGGGEAVTGDGALTAPVATLSGTGARGVQDLPGPIALVGPAATLSGTGTVSVPGPVYEGTGALTAPPATLSGTGTRGVVGTGALVAPSCFVNGTGAGVSSNEFFTRLAAHLRTRKRAVRSAHGGPKPWLH